MFKELKKEKSEIFVLFDFMGAKISSQRNKIRKEKRKRDTRRKKAGSWLNCVTLPLPVPGENTKVFLYCKPYVL